MSFLELTIGCLEFAIGCLEFAVDESYESAVIAMEDLEFTIKGLELKRSLKCTTN